MVSLAPSRAMLVLSGSVSGGAGGVGGGGGAACWALLRGSVAIVDGVFARRDGGGLQLLALMRSRGTAQTGFEVFDVLSDYSCSKFEYVGVVCVEV